MHYCLGCGEEVDIDECEEEDDGNHEDFQGASVWHPCVTLLSPCCGEELFEFGEL